MQILILLSNLEKAGGIQKYNKNLLNSLKNLKLKFKILELKESDIENKLFFLIKFFLFLLIYNPNIIFCTHINFSPLCFFIKKLFKIKYITFTHGTEVWDIKNKLKLKSLKFSDKIVSVSSFTKEKIKQQTNLPEEKFFILQNVVDDKKFFPKEKPEYLLKRQNLSKEDKILFTLCRMSSLEQYKGYDKVIEALPEILSKISNVKYILGGKADEIELKRIKDLIKKFKLEDKVLLIGEIDDNELNDYYNLCDIFIMPSKGEGFGIVFIEALACGKIVIVSNKDASREAILNGEIGILVDPDNTIEIAEAVIKVFKKEIKPELLNSDLLRKKTIENFGPDKFKGKISVLINQLICSKS